MKRCCVAATLRGIEYLMSMALGEKASEYLKSKRLRRGDIREYLEEEWPDASRNVQLHLYISRGMGYIRSSNA